MEIVAGILVGIGLLIILVAGIWTLILQFRTSVIWGLGCIFVPFVALIWLALYWSEGKVPFFYSLLGILVLAGGLFLLQAQQA